MSYIPRESIEFQPITITLDGVPATAAQYSLTTGDARPTTWTNVTTLGSEVGFIITGLATGRHYVWAKLTSAPETPVIQAGAIDIT